jgi:hypothetical protein
VNDCSKISEPEIIANISIAPDADLGSRDVTLINIITGETIFTYQNGFTVEAAPAPSPAGGGFPAAPLLE